MDELPSFNLHQIDKRRDAMLERLFFPHFNVTFDGQDLLGLARQLQRYLPDVDAGVILSRFGIWPEGVYSRGAYHACLAVGR